MLLATCLVLSSAVFPAYLSFLYPTQRFQFVGTGESAQIPCTSAEKTEDGGLSFSWYKRRESSLPVLIKHCIDGKTGDRFVCRSEAYSQNSVLEILNVQRSDSGIYFCVTRNYNVSNGLYLLIVGDSYTPSTRVMLLKPSKQGPSSQLGNQLACVVHGANNLVQVSWDVPGDLPPEAWTLLAKNNSGSLTFVSLLRFPVELHSSGGNITCKVRFNSSSTSVKKSAVFNASSSTDDHGNCQVYTVSFAVMGVLALLLIFLSFIWVRIGLSRPGNMRSYTPGKNNDNMPYDGICYAQLDFQAKTQDERKRRPAAQGKKSKILKDV
ncbi:uncharacterized protein LOC117039183 [Lacerta agilis]|uniref:uncharacterized protein LOC117039183 n=1 Tax=Lacerta agilis TaxID=80427 RepID=UPI00141A301B|nr:uncharacterized protein LOC117039183 [Lacerta agilis]